MYKCLVNQALSVYPANMTKLVPSPPASHNTKKFTLYSIQVWSLTFTVNRRLKSSKPLQRPKPLNSLALFVNSQFDIALPLAESALGSSPQSGLRYHVSCRPARHNISLCSAHTSRLPALSGILPLSFSALRPPLQLSVLEQIAPRPWHGQSRCFTKLLQFWLESASLFALTDKKKQNCENFKEYHDHSGIYFDSETLNNCLWFTWRTFSIVFWDLKTSTI